MFGCVRCTRSPLRHARCCRSTRCWAPLAATPMRATRSASRSGSRRRRPSGAASSSASGTFGTTGSSTRCHASTAGTASGRGPGTRGPDPREAAHGAPGTLPGDLREAALGFLGEAAAASASDSKRRALGGWGAASVARVSARLQAPGRCGSLSEEQGCSWEPALALFNPPPLPPNQITSFFLVWGLEQQ
jgi:hypothetical protein